MSLAEKFSSWRRYRNTVNELNRMSARDLADMGISRCDIPEIARRSR